MLFKKLFKLLVVSGSMMGAAQGCTAARADPAKKAAAPDAGTPAPDAGAKAETGGGAPGW